MSRTLLALAAAVILAPAAAFANLESEAVQTYEPLPVQIVQVPGEPRSFAVPNVSEFDPGPAAMGSVTITPYPAERTQDRDDGLD